MQAGGGIGHFEGQTLYNSTQAGVAELVDAHVSGTCSVRSEGSNPFFGTLFLSKRNLIFSSLDQQGIP